MCYHKSSLIFYKRIYEEAYCIRLLNLAFWPQYVTTSSYLYKQLKLNRENMCCNYHNCQ
jgi:hypothetical protein